MLLTRPNGEIDAQLLRQMLAGEGIHAMVKNRDPVSAESGGMGPPWAYELWVLRRDLRRAREIIGWRSSGARRRSHIHGPYRIHRVLSGSDRPSGGGLLASGVPACP